MLENNGKGFDVRRLNHWQHRTNFVELLEISDAPIDRSKYVVHKWTYYEQLKLENSGSLEFVDCCYGSFVQVGNSKEEATTFFWEVSNRGSFNSDVIGKYEYDEDREVPWFFSRKEDVFPGIFRIPKEGQLIFDFII